MKNYNSRKGLGKGMGVGYKNLAPMDSHIHSLSAKGVKTYSLNMYGIDEIRRMNREAGTKARGKQPFYVSSLKDITSENLRSIPNFGDYRPKGWKLNRTLFVDSSGLGQEGEMALTFQQFLKEVKSGYGYAIIEAGQFQVNIGEFQKGVGMNAKGISKAEIFYTKKLPFDKLYHEIHLDRNPTIDIPRVKFNKHWKKMNKDKVMVEGDVQRNELERLFQKYNDDGYAKDVPYSKGKNPLSTPKGQEKVRRSGTGHTSMSVGDIIKVDSDIYMVAPTGFKKVKVIK